MQRVAMLEQQKLRADSEQQSGLSLKNIEIVSFDNLAVDAARDAWGAADYSGSCVILVILTMKCRWRA